VATALGIGWRASRRELTAWPRLRESTRILNTRKGLYSRMSWCEKCSVEARRLLNPCDDRLVLVAFPWAPRWTITIARKVPAQTIVPSLPGWSGVKQEIRGSGTSLRADRPNECDPCISGRRDIDTSILLLSCSRHALLLLQLHQDTLVTACQVDRRHLEPHGSFSACAMFVRSSLSVDLRGRLKMQNQDVRRSP
jgi:hypothetical protein